MGPGQGQAGQGLLPSAGRPFGRQISSQASTRRDSRQAVETSRETNDRQLPANYS